MEITYVTYSSIHSYIYFRIYIYMNINKIYITLIHSGLIEGVDARAITIQRGGTVHLFIGTGRSPNKDTFMTLTCTHNRNINLQGLTSLFLFGSASCLTFVATLSRSYHPSVVASAFIIIAFRQCLRLEDLRRGRRSSTSPYKQYLRLEDLRRRRRPQQ
jgi:hypothetical protein